LIVWDTTTGKQLRELQVPDEIFRIAVAPDSRHVAAANSNGTVSLYRLAPAPVLP
jgi:WD40 repeat protein